MPLTKNHLTPEQLRALFARKVVVEEKMDGEPRAFLAGCRYLVFAEDLLVMRSVFYRIPGRYAVFDIFDMEKEVFLDSEGRMHLSSDIRKGLLCVPDTVPADFFPVPIVASGNFRDASELSPLMSITSAYAVDPITGRNSAMEGLVIKPERELSLSAQLRAKMIRPEFDNEAKQEYLGTPEQKNLIDPAVP
ncbi:MAG: RNA ligase family protein [Candidatus Micrarchaeota archaeon]